MDAFLTYIYYKILQGYELLDLPPVRASQFLLSCPEGAQHYIFEPASPILHYEASRQKTKYRCRRRKRAVDESLDTHNIRNTVHPLRHNSAFKRCCKLCFGRFFGAAGAARPELDGDA